jgi:hypothetical protein
MEDAIHELRQRAAGHARRALATWAKARNLLEAWGHSYPAILCVMELNHRAMDEWQSAMHVLKFIERLER